MRILTGLVAMAVAVAASTGPALAGELRAYDNASFRSAQSRNRPVVLFVHAPWCPVCRAQEQAVTQLLADPRFKNVTVMKVDFDTQKTVWSKFGATQQSTLIGFHGRRETARLSHNKDPEKIAALLASTLR